MNANERGLAVNSILVIIERKLEGSGEQVGRFVSGSALSGVDPAHSFHAR